MGDFGTRYLAQLPDLSRRTEYRFRYVSTDADLSPFVQLSDAESVITGANPGLEGEARRELYRQWCQWTARFEQMPWYDPRNEVKTFLTLERLQPDGTWLPIAVSILLPLTREGGRHLRLFRQSDTVGRVGGVAHHQERVVRYHHHGWAVALLLRHVSEFWNADFRRSVTFLSEPDNPRIAKMLNDLRFLEENGNALSGNIFVLRYPLDEDKYGPEDEAGLEAIFNLMRLVSGIPIVR